MNVEYDSHEFSIIVGNNSGNYSSLDSKNKSLGVCKFYNSFEILYFFFIIGDMENKYNKVGKYYFFILNKKLRFYKSIHIYILNFNETEKIFFFFFFVQTDK